MGEGVEWKGVLENGGAIALTTEQRISKERCVLVWGMEWGRELVTCAVRLVCA